MTCDTATGERCKIRAYGKARLFYWPVPETVPRNMCAEDPATGGTPAPDWGKHFNHAVYSPLDRM